MKRWWLGLLLGARLMAAPAEGDAARVLEAVKEYQKAYLAGMPGFVCVQEVRRLMRPTMRDPWRLEYNTDVEVSLVRGREQYRVLRYNGAATGMERSADASELGTVGEFAMVMRLLFHPEERAEFRVKGLEKAGGRRLWRVDVEVGQEHSHWYIGLRNESERSAPGYGGRLWVEDNGAIRKIELVARKFPKDSMLTATSWVIDYAEVEIGGLSVLLPAHSRAESCNVKAECARNEIRFVDYRKFEVESRLVP